MVLPLKFYMICNMKKLALFVFYSIFNIITTYAGILSRNVIYLE